MLSEAEVLSRISKFYQDDLPRTRSLLASDEQIVWAGNHFSGAGEHSWIGYCILTTYRAIQVDFSVKAGGLFGREAIFDKDWTIPALPTHPLKTKEVESRRVTQVPLQRISQVQRNDHNVSSKRISHLSGKDYEAYVKGSEMILVGLTVSQAGVEQQLGMWVYGLQMGDEAYRILDDTVRKGTSAPGDPFLDKLERLAALHKSGHLNDSEYEKAKQRLLNN